MATLIRVQVSIYKAAELQKDWITNTFYLNHTDLDPFEPTDYMALAQDTADLFIEYRPYPQGWNRCTVKLYNMDDDEPRRPRATKTEVNNNTGSEDNGPREVALCLSGATLRNVPRERCRLYIGPWGKAALDERPSEGTRQALGALSAGLQALGGVNVDWVVHSTTGAQETHAVEQWWVDDEWDTQRRRGLRATQRLSGTTAENSP